MRHPKDNDHAGRRSAAADAKAALLQAHRAAKEAAEPTRLARQQERLSEAAAKAERQAERARIKLEEQERALAEAARLQEAADAAAKAEVQASEKRQASPITGVTDEAAQKAERDRRYANRKARQR